MAIIGVQFYSFTHVISPAILCLPLAQTASRALSSVPVLGRSFFGKLGLAHHIYQ